MTCPAIAFFAQVKTAVSYKESKMNFEQRRHRHRCRHDRGNRQKRLCVRLGTAIERDGSGEDGRQAGRQKQIQGECCGKLRIAEIWLPDDNCGDCR